MSKTWWTLGVMLTMSAVACSGCSNDTDGTDGTGSTDKIVCTGTYSGGATGKVKFCSLSATKLSNGQLSYTLQIEPDTSGSVVSNDNLTLITTGEPKKGTYALDTFSSGLSRVSVKDDKDYEVVRSGGEQRGKATLTVDSVPAGQNLGGNNVQYDNLTGKAEIQYTAPPGSSYTDTVSLTLSIQAQ